MRSQVNMENKKKHNGYVHFKFFLSIMIALPVLSVSNMRLSKIFGKFPVRL